jgi:hypothetical protein
MPLSKQLIPVVFEGGLDTKTGKQTVVPGKFLVLENCRRLKANKTTKRYGFTSLGMDIASGGSMTRGSALSKFKEDLLLFGRASTNTTRDKLFSYSSTNDNWLDRGSASTAVIDSLPIIRNSYKQAEPDIAVGAGLTLSVWQDSRGGARCSVIDNGTGAVILYDAEVSTLATQIRCVYLTNVFVMVYRASDSTLRTRTISTLAPTVINAEQTVIGSGIPQASFDVIAATDFYALYAVSTGAATTQYGYILQSGLIGDVLDGVPAPITAAVTSARGCTIEVDQVNSRLYIGTIGSLYEVGLICNAYSFASRNITIKVLADFSAIVYYEIGAPKTTNHYIKQTPFTWSGSGAPTGLSISVFMRSVGLVSKAFILDGEVYVGAAFESNTQPTYFVIRSDGLIVSRALGGLGNGLTKNPAGALVSGLCSTPAASDTSKYMLFGVKLKLEAKDDGTLLSSSVGLNRIQVSVSSVTYSTDTIGENLLIAGGTLLNYDGVSVTEHGFHVFPEEVSSNLVGGTSTFPALATYTYQVTYEWIDAQGQIHRSAPSFLTQETLVLTTDKIEITIPKLRLTQKQNGRAPVKICVYRSDADLSAVLYKLREFSNDNTVEAGVIKTDDEVIYTDTNADAAGLTSREILYTTGGVLENIAPPSSKVLARHKNRIFLGDLEDTTQVAYSREWVYGEGLNFSDGLFVRVDALGGKVTAMGALDDKLVIFKRDRIFALSGDGPVDTGANDTFTLPILVSGDVGTTDPDSLVIMPDGLMFKSDKGIYLLSTGMQLDYVGAPVEDFNHLSVSGAVLMEDLNEVRFTTSDGSCLVYNYYFKQWSVFTNYAAESCVIGLNSFLHVKTDGTVNQEIPDTYDDNGSRIKQALETSWLSFAGLQGFQRVYWIHCLGEFISHHFTEMKLAYDFESVYNETVYFDTRVGLGTGVYGDTGPYGSGGYGGTGSSGVWQFRCKPKRQRCEAVKIRLEDIDTIGLEAGGSFDFVGLSFVVGNKKNGMRQTPAKTVGSGV